MKTMKPMKPTRRCALFSIVLSLTATVPLAAGELIIPLSAGVSNGTTYATRVWITNTGATARRWTYSLVAPNADGTKAPAGKSINVGPGATVPVTGLAPAGQGGMIVATGAPQLVLTARLEATAQDGSLRAAVAGPLVSGHDLAAAGGTLHLHGLSHKQGGLITNLYLINASHQAAQCRLDAYRDDGGTIAIGVRYALPPLSTRVIDGALATLGATSIDEARFAVSCDQAFYAYARVDKPGSGELNVMKPAQPLGH